MANEQQQNTAHKIAHEIARVFFMLSAYAIGFFEGRLADKVALLIVLRKDIQNTLSILLSSFAIPDKRKFTRRDNTQRRHLHHRTPKLFHIRILKWPPTTN